MSQVWVKRGNGYVCVSTKDISQFTMGLSFDGYGMEPSKGSDVVIEYVNWAGTDYLPGYGSYRK